MKNKEQPFRRLNRLIEAEIDSDRTIETNDEFRQWAFTMLSNAFGDKFDASKATKFVENLIDRKEEEGHKDFGTIIGILKRSLSNG